MFIKGLIFKTTTLATAIGLYSNAVALSTHEFPVEFVKPTIAFNDNLYTDPGYSFTPNSQINYFSWDNDLKNNDIYLWSLNVSQYGN